MNIHDLDTWLAKNITQFNSSKITKLAPGAFAIQKKLTTVTIPNVTVIPSYAFYMCNSLTTINANEIIQLNNESLSNCQSLTNIDLSHVKYAYSYSICGNDSLMSIDLASLEVLNWGAIWNIYGKIWIPSTCRIVASNFIYKSTDSAVIYTDAIQKPDDWVNDWNQAGYTVVWGATHEEFENA